VLGGLNFDNVSKHSMRERGKNKLMLHTDYLPLKWMKNKMPLLVKQ
jgi:hypothetical protein